jgi:hypothetical protein
VGITQLVDTLLEIHSYFFFWNPFYLLEPLFSLDENLFVILNPYGLSLIDFISQLQGLAQGSASAVYSILI